MGITAKQTGKLRGIFRKIENAELQRKERMKNGNPRQKKEKTK